MTVHTLDFTASIDMETITDRIDELEDMQPLDNDDELAELDALKLIAEELRGMGGDHKWNGDWYPGYLIHEDEFEGYMDDTIRDIYFEHYKDLPSFMIITLDYDALKQDYTEHSLDGNTFLAR